MTVKPNADPDIYCLSLPRRNEDDDQSHGSILLVEGKLVGLYLEVSSFRFIFSNLFESAKAQMLKYVAVFQPNCIFCIKTPLIHNY